MTDDDRYDLEYLVELLCSGLIYESDWYHDMVITEPERLDRLCAVAESVLILLMIDRKTDESNLAEANAVIQKIMQM